jgi:hypothetical protein
MQTLPLGGNQKHPTMAVSLVTEMMDSIQLLDVPLPLNHWVVLGKEVVRHLFKELLAQASPMNRTRTKAQQTC